MTQSKNQQGLFIVGAVVIVAVVVFVGIVLVSQNALNTGSADIDAPASRQEDGGYVLGDENAPITIVIFSNYFCGHCQNYKSTVDRIIENFVNTGKARVEHRLVANTNDSLIYAQLTECATEQKGSLIAWEAMDLLFNYSTTRSLSGNDAGRELATELQLNYAQLLECTVTSDQYQIDSRLAQSAGTTGTPSVRVRFAGDEIDALQPISPQYTSGGVDYEVLARVIEDANN